jgi:hypothetical protein
MREEEEASTLAATLASTLAATLASVRVAACAVDRLETLEEAAEVGALSDWRH